VEKMLAELVIVSISIGTIGLIKGINLI